MAAKRFDEKIDPVSPEGWRFINAVIMSGIVICALIGCGEQRGRPSEVSRPDALSQEDIADFYLKLPAEIYQCVDMGPTLSLEHRKEMIALAKVRDPRVEGAILLDIPNGYLEVTGSDSGERFDLTMALFRQQDRSALIALAADENFELEAESGGGPATHFFAFYTVGENAWEDVTERVAPLWPIPDSYVVLPRYGKTIEIYSRGKEKLIAVWERRGDGFEARELRTPEE